MHDGELSEEFFDEFDPEEELTFDEFKILLQATVRDAEKYFEDKKPELEILSNFIETL